MDRQAPGGVSAALQDVFQSSRCVTVQSLQSAGSGQGVGAAWHKHTISSQSLLQ